MLVLLVMPAAAGIRESALSKLQGYTIVGVLTITGYVDKDGKVKDNFEGCDFERKIVFDGGKVLLRQLWLSIRLQTRGRHPLEKRHAQNAGRRQRLRYDGPISQSDRATRKPKPELR